MLKNDADELSIQDQMYIYTLNYARLFCGFAIVLGVILALILLLFEHTYHNNFLSGISATFLTLFIIIVPILAWSIITGKKKMSDLGQIMTKYTNDVYFMALGLTPHKNDKNIPEDFYKMCLSVFPKLKEANKKSLEKTGEVLEFKKLTFKDDDDDNSFSVTIPNSVLYGDEIFIIKYFEKTNVDYDQLNQYIKIINKYFKSDISRIVCLARNFDTGILNEYEKLRKLSDADLDLIIVTDNGFSGLKI